MIRALVLACIVAMACVPSDAARRERISLRHATLDLPGPPAKVVPADLDADGRTDLVVVVAYREVEEIGEDRIENLVQISVVIPALFDRREVRWYRATAAGGYEPGAEPLALPRSVLHMEPGPPGHAVIAVTDDGLAELVVSRSEDGGMLELVPLLVDPPFLAGTGAFQAELSVVHDLDGDGDPDVLFPSSRGPSIYLLGPDGLANEPASRVEAPGRESAWWHPYPEVVQVDGDGVPDLVFRRPADDRFDVLLGDGAGGFRPPRGTPTDCHDRGTDVRRVVEPGLYPWPEDLIDVRDLDGDGRAEVVRRTEEEREGKGGLKQDMKEAKRPRQRYRMHDVGADVVADPEPYTSMLVEGYTFEDADMFTMDQFQDLDGDGREDLVTVTLRFSLLKAVAALATKRITIGLDFHVWCQQDDRSFREVTSSDLSEKLKLNLNKLEIRRFAQFAGDFDGDGRQDFTHFGRGKLVTVHRGQPGCRYPDDPDLAIEIDAEPESLDLIRVEDLDGDDISDIRITRPLEQTDVDVTAPVRLDLYLSGVAP